MVAQFPHDAVRAGTLLDTLVASKNITFVETADAIEALCSDCMGYDARVTVPIATANLWAALGGGDLSGTTRAPPTIAPISAAARPSSTLTIPAASAAAVALLLYVL
jgi:hypothetical protein